MIEGAIVKSQPILFTGTHACTDLDMYTTQQPLEDPAPAPKRNDGRSKRPAAKIHGMKSVKS
ncbi:hypothetical protein BATDEDRAFT_85386 [Batrachochytrium dendrobatidis JAM81]|uniref:Uncharacterized protein n=1 Tax=Batrachochytrium dendrobatidis (strain JAM81 / FGSC 10211) TaxID=684364 RepID=F4NRT2_BATDJ|nr:uncharacterized protein BATDEDRAFT_85386 [Batrachochytrium dendrobatidis JAM81]EGF84186.1 hypothetical protein BATDEDRAFT_85386 [Batrachochytrium dendrobatidis JAM81]|eukprot:XP_006676366.1 hypothetical protein BATDEDRAFT_85386 [Batrachochytrium dendrobatidis JAM81]